MRDGILVSPIPLGRWMIRKRKGNHVDSERHVSGKHNRSPAEAGYNTLESM